LSTNRPSTVTISTGEFIELLMERMSNEQIVPLKEDVQAIANQLKTFSAEQESIRRDLKQCKELHQNVMTVAPVAAQAAELVTSRTKLLAAGAALAFGSIGGAIVFLIKLWEFFRPYIQHGVKQ
jgi:hypothetical protein